MPLQPLTDDSVYEPAFEAVVPPLVTAFRPDALVIQLGIDSHRTDPLTHLSLTVQGFTRPRLRLAPAPRPARGRARRRRLRPRQRGPGLDRGVGGHERRGAATRCRRRAIRTCSASASRDPTLSDPPETQPGETRRWAEEYARRQVGEIQDRIFPLHGL